MSLFGKQNMKKIHQNDFFSILLYQKTPDWTVVGGRGAGCLCSSVPHTLCQVVLVVQQ